MVKGMSSEDCGATADESLEKHKIRIRQLNLKNGIDECITRLFLKYMVMKLCYECYPIRALEEMG
jgi:hypothetical protein